MRTHSAENSKCQQTFRSSTNTNLPFPFVGDALSKRFKVDPKDDEDNWFYMGREKFVELLNKLRHVQQSRNKKGFWLYGTKGYGKSHLLAALVCHLVSQGERVICIP